MKLELVSKSVGVGPYENLSNEDIISAVARHGVIKEDNGKLVKYLMDNKHLSPLQHVFFSFKVETSRAMSAQIFRHRSLNFQETSQRYDLITEFEDIEIRMQHKSNRQSSTDVFDPLVPDTFGLFEGLPVKASEMNAKLLDIYSTSYVNQVEAGVAKECARMMLPMCSKTTIHISGTLRDLLAFLNIRMESHAQKEVVLIATGIGEVLEAELPDIFSNIDWRNGLFL